MVGMKNVLCLGCRCSGAELRLILTIVHCRTGVSGQVSGLFHKWFFTVGWTEAQPMLLESAPQCVPKCCAAKPGTLPSFLPLE